MECRAVSQVLRNRLNFTKNAIAVKIKGHYIAIHWNLTNIAEIKNNTLADQSFPYQMLDQVKVRAEKAIAWQKWDYEAK